MSDKMSREEIFSQSQAAEKGYQTSNVVRDDFGWEIPVDQAPLPSRGLLYDKESSLHQKEVIEIRAMTAKEEEILIIRDGIVYFKIL